VNDPLEMTPIDARIIKALRAATRVVVLHLQPAASLTDMAANAGATTIQVNPNPTDADGSVTFTLRGPAGTVLPQLVANTWTAPR
jgi:NAD-dependent SIR2 family protein deacetylase